CREDSDPATHNPDVPCEVARWRRAPGRIRSTRSYQSGSPPKGAGTDRDRSRCLQLSGHEVGGVANRLGTRWHMTSDLESTPQESSWTSLARYSPFPLTTL